MKKEWFVFVLKMFVALLFCLVRLVGWCFWFGWCDVFCVMILLGGTRSLWLMKNCSFPNLLLPVFVAFDGM